MSILTMKNIYKSFDQTTALNNVNFEVSKGEIFGFLGPSGAGKTTTVKLFTGQLIPTKGEVQVLGMDVSKNRSKVFNEIGVLTDTSGIYERLSVFDNLMVFAKLNKVPSQKVKALLEQVGLGAESKKSAAKLSKGMKQRVMIVRALLHDPKILFLDEPTASLDPGTTLEIHKLLKTLNEQGTTVFLTTHDMMEAEKLCHRVGFLNNGEIAELGSPEGLKTKYAADGIEITLFDGQKLVLPKTEQGGLQITKLLSEGSVRSIKTLEPTLEKIFLDLTGRELS